MPRWRQPCTARSGRGGALTRIGVDDQRARPGEPSARRRGLEARVRRDSPHLWRSHHPETVPQAAALDIELSL
jgi:hypothetical protein